MSMLILLMIPILVIFLVFFIIAGVRAEPKKGGEDMIKNVYIYLVLFATLMMTIGGSVGAFMAAADIVAPAPYYQTFEEYKRLGGTDKLTPEAQTQENTKLTDEELRESYDAMVSAEKQRQIVRGTNQLIKSLGWIVIPLPVFLYFQRRLTRKKNEE